ncbi:MAG: AsmA family protein [Gammaproteobacteria bacterium]
MPKPLKFILVTGASILMLVTVLIGGIFLFVDPNDYKDKITTAVHEATGRQLTIAGDIELSFYPWLGLSLGATQLSNAQGFGDTPFASVETVEIKVKLLPLFQQRLEMQKIRLNGLRANLAKNKSGRSNWDDLVSPSPATSTQKILPEDSTPESPVKSGDAKPDQTMGTLAALAIEGLELENAHMEWNDQQANQHIVIDNLTLRTGPLAITTPVDLSLSLDVKVNDPALDGHVDFKGQVSLDFETQQYRANNLDLMIKATGAGLPVSPIDVHLQANLKADLKQQRANISDMQLSMLSASITGQIDIAKLDKAPTARGQIAIAGFSLKEIAKKLGITLPNTRDAAVFNKVNLNVDFNGNMDEANISKLVVMLDDTELTGTASVKNFAAPAIRFDIMVDDIDIDRYLPPATETTASTPASPGAAAATTTQLPLELLRALNIEGNFKLGKLKITGARSSDITLSIKAKNGKITLNPIKAKLYNGSYKGNIVMDVRSDTPKLSFKESINDVNVGPLLKDTLGKELVSGTANASAQLTASGTELAAIKKTLNGKAKFSFQNGAVKGVNIGQKLREAYAKLKKKPAPPKTENETDFAEMSGSVTVTNGIVSNKDLSMKSPLLRIHGKGSVNLPKEKIKYLINASIVESNEGQAGKELKELKSLTIPIRVTGTFDNPKFTPDLGLVLQAEAKKEVKKRIKKEKKKLEKKLKNELKKLFKF